METFLRNRRHSWLHLRDTNKADELGVTLVNTGGLIGNCANSCKDNSAAEGQMGEIAL